MLDHVSLPVTDLPRAAAFYDALFGRLGARRVVDGERAIAYGRVEPAVWIVLGDARTGGGHVALAAAGRAAVDAAHASGLAGGGADAGAPEARPQRGRSYYSGYLRDPDGNRLELVSAGR